MSNFALTLLVALVSHFLVAESIPLSSFKDVAVACNVTKREFLALGELYGSPNKVVELAVILSCSGISGIYFKSYLTVNYKENIKNE